MSVLSGDGKVVPESPLSWHFWEQILHPYPCLCYLELVPARSCFSVSGSPACQCHRPHPTCCMLSSSLLTPPGTRHCPETSLISGPEEKFRQVLSINGVSVSSPKQRNTFPSPTSHPVKQQENTESTDSFSFRCCCLEVVPQKDPLQLLWG